MAIRRQNVPVRFPGALAASFLLFSLPAFADRAAAVKAHQAGLAAFSKGDYDGALREFSLAIKEDSSLAESWTEYRDFWFMKEPALPAGTKMELWAFRSFEDYRRHCVDTKAEAQLNAAGFASSESNVVVGWNKTGDHRLFLQTMVHEAAHLYYFRVAAPAALPSWHAEGMATYFEGFEPDMLGWRFGKLAVGRLDMAREAMKAGNHLPLSDLLSGDALALINSDTRKALLFYAESWALNFYLVRTDNQKYREGYDNFRKAVMTGKKASLAEFVGDLKQLERDWVTFVCGLQEGIGRAVSAGYFSEYALSTTIPLSLKSTTSAFPVDLLPPWLAYPYE
ncbi:MAG: hypothetical protein FD180_113 [Planctomycetota bacterium]|nr:MAG: hypothetical protein FD180_113 [Planctomycetota bacterium]